MANAGHPNYVTLNPDGTVNVPDLSLFVKQSDVGVTVVGTAGGGGRIEGGAGRAVITNGVSGPADAVPHNLGGAPLAVAATALTTPDGRDDYIVDLASADPLNLHFTVRAGAAEQFPLANPTTVNFYWIALV